MSDQLDALTSTWQHTILTAENIQTPSGIQTRNPSKQTAVEPHLRPRAHLDQQWLILHGIIVFLLLTLTVLHYILCQSDGLDWFNILCKWEKRLKYLWITMRNIHSVIACVPTSKHSHKETLSCKRGGEVICNGTYRCALKLSCRMGC